MYALEIKDLTKIYSGTTALNHVDLQVADGDFFGLLGPNGAGKTTLIGILTSLVNKTSGSAKIFDYDITTQCEAAKSQLGVVPQEFNFNIFENVISIIVNQAGYYGISRKKATKRAEECLSSLGLWEKRNSRANELSGGMKRRLMIARALVHKPRMLILDEPTAGVDIELRRNMWDYLRQLNKNGTTIILTTHYLEEAESLCRNIAIINNGNIIENAPTQELLQKLHKETFIFDLAKPADGLTKLATFDFRLTGPQTLEVDFYKGQRLNELFGELSQQKISIGSMRNKTNRLEELFVDMLQKDKK